MKFTIERAALTKAINAVRNIVENRNTIPILGNFLLSANNQRLSVTATDLTICATSTVDADIEDEGEICIDAKLMTDIAKKAGNSEISINLEAGKLIVKSGRSRFSLETLPADDFPRLRNKQYDAEFEMDVASLFAPVKFAMSTEETRYFLNGVFFHNAKGNATAVATDGHRMARYIGPEAPAFPAVIVPTKTVMNVPEGVITVSVSDRDIMFSTKDFEMTSKVIDGTFPDYERVIPQNNENVIIVDRDEILRASDRVVSISNEKGRGVKLSFGSGCVGLSAHSTVGDAQDEVEAEYDGEEIEIGINSQYLKDMLAALPSGVVRFHLLDGRSPAVVTGALENWDGVLMPLRV